MNKYEITKKIEEYAPLEIQEKWDCSGWIVQTGKKDVSKIMLCLTVTQDVLNQARRENCDMIISHHPLFCVPIEWKDVDIYCAHTNMDKVKGGTTDTLISALKLSEHVVANEFETNNFFVRYVDYETSLENFILKLKQISPNLRYVNNLGLEHLKKIAFCAGSGSEFINEACKNGADAMVTGDLKFHSAVESPILVFDIGHFESEIMILSVFGKIIGDDVKIVRAKESSPFL